MLPNSVILIETKKFPVLQNEMEEMVNEAIYGKALCQHLEKALPKLNIEVPSFCCEDWGWWLDVVDGDFKMGLCVYSDPDTEKDPEKYVILPSVQKAKRWSWSKLRRIDVSDKVIKIMDSLDRLFRADEEIDKVSRHDNFPF